MTVATVNVTGTLLDGSENPIVGALIVAQLDANLSDGTILYAALDPVSTTSASDGTWVLPVIPNDDDTILTPPGSAWCFTITYNKQVILSAVVRVIMADSPSVPLLTLANLLTPPPLGAQYVSSIIAGSGVTIDHATGAVTITAEGGGGGGLVNSVTAADTSVVVGGTSTDPTVRTNTLDVIAADHPPAANWSNNSHKITSLATGTAPTDAANVGQLPTPGGVVDSVTAGDGTITIGGTTANPTVKVTPGKGITSITSSATPTLDTDLYEVLEVTALATNVTSFTTNLTGTPHDGDSLVVRVTDNGTPRTLIWGASFEASTVALPSSTVASQLLTAGFYWNTATSAWRCVAVA